MVTKGNKYFNNSSTSVSLAAEIKYIYAHEI
jgi:hypothetical protein